MTQEQVDLRDAILDILARDLLQAFDAERLDGVACDRCPVLNGLYKDLAIDRNCGSADLILQVDVLAKVAQKTAGKAISGSSRIDQTIAWVSRYGQHQIGSEYKTAVLAFLENDPTWPHRLDAPSRLDVIRLARELFGLDVVDK